MIEKIELYPGVTLRCFPDKRFKQGCMSVQFVRPMCREEAAVNALIPAILLRGCETSPDLRDITLRLDDLYGAAVGTMVRRIGDYQTTGLCCNFIDDSYALQGDRILEPMMDFLTQLLLQPVLENGAFCGRYTESEKKNLISAMEAQRNDKRLYASAQMLKKMCTADSFGIPRLGEKEQVEKITPDSAYAHYRRILRESRVEIFYVGSAEPQRMAQLLKERLGGMERSYVNLPDQTAFRDGGGGSHTEVMDVAQGKLCMGFVTPITLRTDDFAAMQVLNTIFGAGMTSKLFMQIREKQSLCYDIGSGYHGSKGILTVSAGIDCHQDEQVKQQVLRLLEECREGQITPQELTAAKQALISQLRGTHDSAGAIESYYATAALSGLTLTTGDYMEAVEAVSVADVARVARTLELHTVYFLRGDR